MGQQPQLKNVPGIPRYTENLIPWNTKFKIMKQTTTEKEKRIINFRKAAIRTKLVAYGRHIGRSRSRTAMRTTEGGICLKRFSRPLKEPDVITLWHYSKDTWDEELD